MFKMIGGKEGGGYCSREEEREGNGKSKNTRMRERGEEWGMEGGGGVRWML